MAIFPFFSKDGRDCYFVLGLIMLGNVDFPTVIIQLCKWNVNLPGDKIGPGKRGINRRIVEKTDTFVILSEAMQRIAESKNPRTAFGAKILRRAALAQDDMPVTPG